MAQPGAAASTKQYTKEFHDLVKAVGECKSKTEEDAIVAREAHMLKQRLADPKLDRTKLKEYLLRSVYVEMLGHDATFAHIHAVKAAHESAIEKPGGLGMKKMGYLATSLFLDDQHELILLIINTFQQDLKSPNVLVLCTALTAICKLLSADTVPAVLPSVVELLGHSKEHVRKKAIMAMHRCWQQAPAACEHVVPRFRQMLCDKDPSVMAAAVTALYDLIAADPSPYKNLVPSFVNILKQVIDHRLPASYEYHKSPAPFIQIRLLKILGVLGAGDEKASEDMYAVLGDVLKRSDSNTTIGNAIVYECVKTVTNIYPLPRLLELAAGVVARFLKAKSHNLKYAGISALAAVVRVSPKYAAQHQLAVIDCLEDPDETLRKGTLELLYRMTKTNNVEVIVERMTDYLRTASNNETRQETAARIVELAERYAPSSAWFINTMNTVFEECGDLVQPAAAHNLMRLIAEGAGDDDEDADNALRASAVKSYMELLEKPKLPRVFLQVIVWVLGEYGTLAGGFTPAAVMDALCSVVEFQPNGGEVAGPVVSAIAKICAQTGAPLTSAADQLVRQLMTCTSTDLQQRAYELRALIDIGNGVIGTALPPDASCEDLEADENLAFLDSYVAQAIAAGASPYREQESISLASEVPDLPTTSAAAASGLRFQAYEQAMGYRPSTPPRNVASAAIDDRSSLQSPAPELKLAGAGGPRRWGPQAAAPPRQPAPAAPAAASTSGSTAAPAATPAATVPDDDFEPTEKERLAASLFGGGGDDDGGRSGGLGRVRGGGVKKKPSAAAASAAAAPAAPVPSLLDLDDPNPAPPPAAQSTDVFSQMEGLSVSMPAPEPAALTLEAKPAVDLDALYGAGPPAAQQPRAAVQPQMMGMQPQMMGGMGMPPQQGGMGMVMPQQGTMPGMMPQQTGMMMPGMQPTAVPPAPQQQQPTPPQQQQQQADPFRDLLS